MLKRWSALTAVALAAALAGACASQKVPAQAAVTAAERAFAAVKVDADKYLPDQAKDVESALDAAKTSLDKGDYQAALTAAQALPARIGALATAVAAKKAELAQTWAALNAALPQVVQAIQSRVDILSKSRKLPAGLDKEKLEGAKTGLAAITQAWTEATTAAGSGNMADAVAKAEGEGCRGARPPRHAGAGRPEVARVCHRRGPSGPRRWSQGCATPWTSSPNAASSCS